MDAPHIARLRARVAAAQDELTRLEYADDLCHVTGAYARAAGVVRAAQDDLVRALAEQIVDECDQLARLEPIARDAMATPHPHTGA